MLGERQKKWVEALESGNYSQGMGRLRTKEGLCCLGVCTDIFQKETGEGVWVQSSRAYNVPGSYVVDEPEWYFVIDGQRHIHYTPPEVMSWVGLEQHSGAYIEDYGLNNMKGFNLADKNDDGWTFIDIAEKIKENPLNLFKEEK